MPALEVAKVKFQWRERVAKVREKLKEKLDKAGKRKLDQLEKGFDPKGLSHALRLSYEAQDLLKHDTLCLPLSEERRKFLLEVKTGKHSVEYVMELLDKETDLVDKLSLGKENTDTKSVEVLLEKLLTKAYTQMELKNLMK